VLLGKVALNTFLIVGFTLHNTTEGLAIVAPLAKATDRVMIRRFVVLGIIAGSPAIVGTCTGGFLYSPIAAIIFLAIGAGAIFQVAFSILLWIASNNPVSENIEDSRRKGLLLKRKAWLDTSSVAGFITGM
jgi:ZIP family zinc transporter